VLEGTNYVTISSVLPFMYRIIRDSQADAPLYMPWETDESMCWLTNLVPEVAAARGLLHDDLVERWVTTMPLSRKAELAMCALLDPRYKGFDWVGADSRLKELATITLRQTWDASVFKPKPVPSKPAAATTTASIPSNFSRAGGATKVTASSILKPPMHSMAIAPSETAPAQAHVTPATPVEDELDKYLALPAVEDPDADVLAWWRDQDCKAGLPNVAQLARQHLGIPASSVGVERLFSRAGRMHDDLRTAMDDGSLEHSLFAAFNTD